MSGFFDRRALELLGIELPIIQAPMAGNDSVELAAAVSEAGGLGSLACALLTPEQILTSWQAVRKATSKPVNLNFFCHKMADPDLEQEKVWREQLKKYYLELKLDPADIPAVPLRMPFDDTVCSVVEKLRPPVLSFHFGLPEEKLLQRVKNTGAKILSTATTVEEALWLEKRGCDAIIAQGLEAGGHRGIFLTKDLATQSATLSLVPKIAAAVTVPVVAAGGIGDAQGIAKVFRAGASAVQLGTAYLFCPEARVSQLYLARLTAGDAVTAVTNLYSGRPARGILNRFMRETGPLSPYAPAFPHAAKAVMPLRKKAEAAGSSDFSQMWAGEAVNLGKAMPAKTLTLVLMKEALELL